MTTDKPTVYVCAKCGRTVTVHGMAERVTCGCGRVMKAKKEAGK